MALSRVNTLESIMLDVSLDLDTLHIQPGDNNHYKAEDIRCRRSHTTAVRLEPYRNSVEASLDAYCRARRGLQRRHYYSRDIS
ncbi:hypothetical protein VTH82DRAFT_657 [Thermothelomyces myriococcoides]